MLSELLRIKEFREEKAEREVSRSSRRLAEANIALERARDELEQCRVSCKRKERALYLDICTRLVQLKDIDSVKLEVSNMKAEVLHFEEIVKSAETIQHSETESLQSATHAYRLAIRMREKFSELELIARNQVLAEKEMNESLELEEVSGNTNGSLPLMRMDEFLGEGRV